jgi:hypothetical protein
LAVGGWRLGFFGSSVEFFCARPGGDAMKVARYEVPGKREEGDAVPTGTIEMLLFFSIAAYRESEVIHQSGPKSQPGQRNR